MPTAMENNHMDDGRRTLYVRTGISLVGVNTFVSSVSGTLAILFPLLFVVKWMLNRVRVLVVARPASDISGRLLLCSL